jgi:outer membrane protein assembly factor BamB
MCCSGDFHAAGLAAFPSEGDDMISPSDDNQIQANFKVGHMRTFGLLFALGIAVVATSRNSVFADDGMAYPLAVVTGKDNVVYVADRNLPGIWKFANNTWSIYFQGSKKYRTPLNAVRCLAIDQDGKLLAGDSATREIYRFDDAGQPQPLTKGNVGIPMAIAVAKDGTIFASDIEIQRIVKIPGLGGDPEPIAEIAAARGLTMDSDGRLIVVCHGKNAVLRLSTDGKEQEVLVEGRPFQFSHHVVAGPSGELFIADGYAKTIWKVEPKTAPVALVAGEPLKNPVGLAWMGDDLLIADPHAKAILRRTADGMIEPLGKPAK